MERYRSIVLKAYVILMVTFFPLVFWDYYFDIADVKFIIFTIISLCTCCACVILRIYSKKNKKINLNMFVKAVIIWFVINLISCLGSEYLETAFFGTDGRSFGMITVLVLTGMLILVGENEWDKEKIIEIFLFTSAVVSILAIINFLGMDFLGFYKGVEIDVRGFYQTTLGHVDICSSFFAIVLPISGICAIKSEGKKKYIYSILAIIIFMGMFGGGCDSGYIVLAMMFMLVVIFSQSYMELIHLITLGIIAICCAKVMMILNGQFKNAKQMDSIAMMVTANKTVMVVLSALILVLILCVVLMKFNEKTFKGVKYTFISVFVIMIISFIAMFCYYSFINTEKEIGSLANLLRYNDKWGSCRGYIWNRAAKFYMQQSWWRKIIGTGPDTLENALTPMYGAEMLRIFSAYYDNTHNEYLQYLITTGVMGLISYIAVIATSFILACRKKCSNVEKAMICGVICYLVQAIVNINQIITTPYMFLMLALIVAENKKENLKE